MEDRSRGQGSRLAGRRRALALAVIVACAAEPAVAAPFLVTADTPRMDAFESAVTLPSGDLVLAGASGIDDWDRGILACRFRGDTLVWATLLPVVRTDRVMLAAESDDSVVLAATTTGDDVVLELDPSGAVTWSESVRPGPGLPLAVTGLAVTASGRIMIPALTWSAGYHQWLVILDGDGLGVAAEELHGFGSAYRIGVAPRGANEACLALPVRTGDIEIACVDDAGTPTQAATIPSPASTWDSLKAMPGGALLLSGVAPSSGVGLAVVDPDLTVRWSADVTASGYRASAATPLGADAAAVVLTSYLGVATPQVVRLDGGVRTWTRSPFDGGAAYLIGACAAADGGVLVAGGTAVTDPTRGHAWLARIDPDGTTTSCPPAAPLVDTRTGPTRSVAVALPATTPATLRIVPHPLVATSWVPRLASPCAPQCVPDAGEPDGGGMLTPLLKPGMALSRNFCDDAEDVAVIAACAGAPVSAWTSSLGPQLDTVLELWTADGRTLLAIDDDSGGGAASRIDTIAPYDGTFRLIVRPKDGVAGPGRDYALEMACSCTWTEWLRVFAGFPQAAPLGVDTACSTDPFDFVSDVVTARLDEHGQPAWTQSAPTGQSVDGTAADLVTRGDWMASLGTAGLVRSRTDGSVVDALQADVFGELVAWDIDADGAVLEGRHVMSRVRADGSASWSVAATPLLPGSSAVRLSGVLTGDGGAVLAGIPDTMQTAMCPVARLRPDGTPLWTVGVPVENIQQTFDVRMALSAGVAVLDFDMRWFVALDLADGRLLWSSKSGDFVVALTATPDGGVLALGSFGLVTRLDAHTGDVSWSGAVRTEVAALGASRLKAADDGSLLIVGSTSVGNIVLRADPLGRSECASVTPTTPLLEPADVALGEPEHAFTRRAPTAPPDVAIPPHPELLPLFATCHSSGDPCLALGIAIAPPELGCAGDPVTLRASVQGENPWLTQWDLHWDGTRFDVESTGAIVSAGIAPGHARVAARAVSQCDLSEVMDVIDFDVAAPPDVAISGPTVRCSAACVPLEATPGFAAYFWSDGELTRSICVSPTFTTTYTVSVQAASGCSWQASHVVLAGGAVLHPVITESCSGGRHLLRAIETRAVSWSWSDGETSQQVLVGPGTWSVTVTDANGCEATASIDTTLACRAPDEVSGPPWTTPLLVRGTANTVASFEETGEPAYDLLVGPIGAWGSPASGVTRCHVPAAPPRVPGTRRQLAVSLPANSWLLVTAANTVAEGIAGARSGGVERSTLPTWTECGPL